jgi:predicted outer membrane repeat protein
MRHSLYFGQGRTLGAGVLVGLIGLLHSPAQAASYGVNLIVNGNAESGPSSSTGAPVTVPGWTPSSAFTVVPYNAPGGFPVLGGPGPSDAGLKFFAGGNADVSTATQPIDLAANAADINAGLVTFDLTGWFGGYLTDDDNAVLNVDFYNGSTKLLTTVIGGFKAVDRNNKTGLFFGGLTGFPVPVNTTRLVLTLTMTRLNSGGNFNDGYADSLSLILRAPAVVTSTADSGAGSLRAAITAGNTITFDPNVFAAASGPHVIILLSALPDLNSYMTITGPGAGVATVQRSSASGTPDFRIFNVANGLPVAPTVIISGITISNGLLEGPNFGPGILNLGTLTLNGSVVTGCHSNGSGGAILNGGTLTLNNSSVSDNQTLDRGGGISNGTSSTLTLNNSSVSRNQSGIDGGGIFNTGTVILNGSTVSGNLAHGGGGIYSAGTLVLSNSTIADNTASVRDGGGIYKQDGVAIIDKCTISGNSASASGGGLINAGAASATLTNCTLSSNTAHDGGGGIENRSSVGQTGLTVRNCTLSGNSAGTNGGGLENSNAYFNASNCTFSGNSAGTGGAIYSIQQTAFGGGSIDNTIFKTGVSGGNINDTSNLVVSTGYNLSNDAGGGVLNQTGDRINTDPMIGPLQNNGGPTFTHALLPGSLAIDKGKSTFTIDQRAAPRPVDDPNSANGSGNASDIGAFEFQGTLPVVLANISGRLPVGTGDNALFAGFIVTGYQPKKVIIRAIGPSLGVAGGLADPTLELRDGSGALLQSNDNWKDSPNKQAIIDSTIPPTNDLESAIVATLPASKLGISYTAIVRGAGNATGIGVVEVYDLDRSLDSKLANISNRGFVQSGDNVLFAGNIVVGQASQKVIIRALGPSVPVPGAMADPTLELRDANGSLLEANDNWVDSPNKQAIIDSTIPPTNNLESAIVRTLTPANYTAIVRGAGGTTGIAVVEVYALN